ncbi:MAG: hypothetical protein ACFFDN_17620 [Candidatus Hodarchaeota archaeon]
MITSNENHNFLLWLKSGYDFKSDGNKIDITLGLALNEIATWIRENLLPDDIFDKNQLNRWAIDNNYILNDK